MVSNEGCIVRNCAIGIQITYIACLQPTVLHRLGGFPEIVPAASHHMRATHADLAGVLFDLAPAGPHRQLVEPVVAD